MACSSIAELLQPPAGQAVTSDGTRTISGARAREYMGVGGARALQQGPVGCCPHSEKLGGVAAVKLIRENDSVVC